MLLVFNTIIFLKHDAFTYLTFCSTCENNGTVSCKKEDVCCLFQHWTEWSECSTDCGEGHTMRFSYCMENGEHCVNNTAAVVDGSWTLWTQWSKCNSNCKGGFRQRNRTCSNPLPKCNGKKCSGKNIQKETCNTDIPCCEMTQWIKWSECSQKCGNGNKNRTRELKVKEDANYCNVEMIQLLECNTDICETKCNVTEWTLWSPCSVSCGVGAMVRERKILAKSEKNDCPKILREEEKCIGKKCKCEENEIWMEEGCEKSCNDSKQCKVAACLCKEGFKRSINNSCITQKTCDSCIINGAEKMPGSIWRNEADECEKCECVGGQAVCSRICAIEKCEQDEELSYDVPNKCCPICVKKSTCALKMATDYLIDSLTGCRSVNKVKYFYCEGSCGSSSEKPVLMNLKNSASSQQNCICCQGITSLAKSVDVVCESKKIRKTSYYDMKSCGCKDCSNS
ncbi:unnamed protein product [Acanthosepion pharaonis]|uniref:Uncharacterized protein n=1 Tax=Acanthosepion pharaonis TaxID=158019 RepID=A0A812B5E5_ACAPH|nr:unnamed protein product [Sepia pharaonis]